MQLISNLNQYTALEIFANGLCNVHDMHVHIVINGIVKYQDVKVLISWFLFLEMFKKLNYERVLG